MMRRSTGMVMRAVLIISMVMVGVPAVARQNVSVELFYNGVWNNHTQDLYSRDAIHINHAILDGQTGLAPSDASLTWKNRDGKMNPDNRLSPLYGLIGHNTPIRMKVSPDIRFSGQVVSWKPYRTQGNTRFDAWVEAKAQGTLRRLGQGEPPVESALYRRLTRITPAPVAWWTLEDGSLVANPTAYVGTAMIADAASVFSHADTGSVSGAIEGPLGANKAIDMSGGGQLTGNVTGTSGTSWRLGIGFRYREPVKASESSNVVTISTVDAAGNPGWWRFSAAPSAANNWAWEFGIQGVSTVLDDGSPALDDGNWHWLEIAVADGSGTNATYSLFIDGVLRASGTNRGFIKAGSLTRVIIADSGDLDGASHAIVWGTNASLSTDVYEAFRGHSGEKAGPRFIRLCAEEGITSTIVGTSDETQVMGPQFPDTALNLLGEIARTDKGFVYDTREQLGLTLRTGRSLNNQTASIILNWNAGHIGGPLEPNLDDAGRANVVIAEQRNGSQFTDSDTTGKLGTAAIGAYKLPVRVNPASAADLPQHAHYHLVLGTDLDPRYSQVVVDLDANPTLTAAASAVNVGSLLALQGIPADLGQPAAELLALGYREMIGSHRRVIAFNARPGGILSHIGMLDGGAKACLQTAGAQLSSAITAEQTAFPVFTSAGPLFTLTPPAGARIIVRDREVMPVTGVASALKDAFGRTVVVGWGTADSGQAWTASGTASVGGGFGQQSLTAGATVLCSAGVSLPDVDIVLGHTGISSAPAGDNVEVGARLRVSGTSYVQVRTFRLPGGGVTINVNEVVGGLEAGSSGFPTVPDVVATDSIAIRLQAFGSALRARAWLVGGIEPLVWQVSLTATHLAAGDVTMRGMLGAAWSGASPLTVFYDNIEIVNPQTFTVTRDPGQRMAHPSGLVRVYQALRLRL